MPTLAELDVEQLIDELARREQRKGKIYDLFPKDGPFARDKYQQHMAFFHAGNDKAARLALAANGVGKTMSMGGYETALHMTGLYPDWWCGFRYTKPVRWWVAGKTKMTTRDNQQSVLIGRPNAEQEGGGLIPTDLIDFDGLRRWPSGGGLVQSLRVRHVSGGWSYMGMRSYDQDLDAFFGENLDGAWMDEPAPILIFSEIMARFRGSEHPTMMVTFTPKKGSTDLVRMFLNEPDDSREVINCTWDDVPHLDEKWKADTLANTPEYMRDTVSKGVPSLGVGAVFPIQEKHILVDPFEIPDHWPRAYGFDGGWHNTAAVWGAYNKDTETWYLYSEHKRGKAEPPIHAAAIKARGHWISGVGDAYATNQSDGEKVIDLYRAEGLKLHKGDKRDKEARVECVRVGLATGKVKVFSTLQEWLREYREYHYDDNGKLVKENDHLMDATQHLIFEGRHFAKTKAMATQPPMHAPTRTFGRKI